MNANGDEGFKIEGVDNVFRDNDAGVAVMYTKHVQMAGNRFGDGPQRPEGVGAAQDRAVRLLAQDPAAGAMRDEVGRVGLAAGDPLQPLGISPFSKLFQGFLEVGQIIDGRHAAAAASNGTRCLGAAQQQDA